MYYKCIIPVNCSFSPFYFILGQCVSGKCMLLCPAILAALSSSCRAYSMFSDDDDDDDDDNVSFKLLY